MIKLTPVRAEVLKALVTLFVVPSPPPFVRAGQVMQKRMEGRGKYDQGIYIRTTEQALEWLEAHVPTLAQSVHPAIGVRWKPTVAGRCWATTQLGVQETK